MTKQLARILFAITIACCLVTSLAAADKRAPAPDKAAVEAATTSIQEAFKSDFAKATATAGKRKLATLMLEQGLKTKDPPVERFALLQNACEIAALAGDLPTARRAHDTLCKEFDVDTLGLRTTMIQQLAELTSVNDCPDLSDYAAKAAAQLEVADRYREAVSAINVAVESARRTKDAERLESTGQLKERIGNLATAHALIEPQAKALQQNPADPTGNLAVGKFLCWNKGDYARGVPMLALGSDAALSKLAESELRASTSETRQAAADGWYEMASQEKGESRVLLLKHAYDLYFAALQGVTGLAERKLKQRLDEIEADLPISTMPLPVGRLHIFRGQFAAAFSPNNRYLATSDVKGVLHLWNIENFRLVRSFTGHAGAVRGLAFSKSGAQLISAGNDKMARIWEVASGAELKSFPVAAETQRFWRSADGKRIVIMNERQGWAYDLDFGRLQKTWDASGGDGGASLRMLSADGKYGISSGITETVRVFDVARNNHVTFNGRTHCYASNLSADGRYALSGGGDGKVRVWNVATRSTLRELLGLENHVYWTSFSPDGKRVIACSSLGNVAIWQLPSGELLHKYPTDGQPLQQAVISPDGRRAFVHGHETDVWLLGLPE